MRNTNHSAATLAPLQFIETPVAIELDEEAGMIAFRAAERDLVRAGFAEMDDMGHYAAPEVGTKAVEVAA